MGFPGSWLLGIAGNGDKADSSIKFVARTFWHLLAPQPSVLLRSVKEPNGLKYEPFNS